MSSDPVELPGLGVVRRVYAIGADAVNSTGVNSVPSGADSWVFSLDPPYRSYKSYRSYQTIATYLTPLQATISPC